MINPVGHKVLVKADDIETKTASGIVLAVDEKLEKGGMQTGIVIAHGDQAWKAFSLNFDGKPWANVGDHILYSRYAGKSILDPEDSEEYLIMNDEDILAILTKETENV